MDDQSQLGSRVRLLRRREGLTQRDLADRLGVSVSYLNLIENDRRPLPSALLLKLARLFQVELADFAAADDGRLGHDLAEVFADPLFEGAGVTHAELRELAAESPAVARGVLTLYGAWREAVGEKGGAERGEEAPALDPARVASEETSDLLQRHLNHFPALEDAAERLWRDAALDRDDLGHGLTRWLRNAHDVTVRVVSLREAGPHVRRFDAHRRELVLSELLPPRSRNFQLALQLGLLSQGELVDRLLAREPHLSDESLPLARIALASYFAGAVLMPYAPFLEAARDLRYDVELLGHRFRTSYEQVCHRLTTLRRPGAEGVPFHFIRVDIAGNISKRFSASGIRFARFSGACPRWNVFSAFLTPGLIRAQVSVMDDGEPYFCFAATVHKGMGGYRSPQPLHAIGLGCRLEHAGELVYADGVDLKRLDAAMPIGVTCRLCERQGCEQRAFPAAATPQRIDENVRGLNFYAGSSAPAQARAARRTDG